MGVHNQALESYGPNVIEENKVFPQSPNQERQSRVTKDKQDSGVRTYDQLAGSLVPDDKKSPFQLPLQQNQTISVSQGNGKKNNANLVGSIISEDNKTMLEEHFQNREDKSITETVGECKKALFETHYQESLNQNSTNPQDSDKKMFTHFWGH